MVYIVFCIGSLECKCNGLYNNPTHTCDWVMTYKPWMVNANRVIHKRSNYSSLFYPKTSPPLPPHPRLLTLSSFAAIYQAMPNLAKKNPSFVTAFTRNPNSSSVWFTYFNDFFLHPFLAMGIMFWVGWLGLVTPICTCGDGVSWGAKRWWA